MPWFAAVHYASAHRRQLRQDSETEDDPNVYPACVHLDPDTYANKNSYVRIPDSARSVVDDGRRCRWPPMPQRADSSSWSLHLRGLIADMRVRRRNVLCVAN